MPETGPEVLMGRRSRRAAFVPDFFVFPGGRLDRDDQLVHPASPLRGDFVRVMAAGSATQAQALAIAAVRETWEETGLMLARSGAIGSSCSIGWSFWRERGLAPDLERLAYLGRAITSSASPIRFHARFFLAPGEAAQGRLGGSGELSDLAWYPIETVLARLPIVDVTEFVLGELLRRDRNSASGSGLAALFAYRRSVPYVRWERL
jgi:8-oxo-dGTP pyrophosphatase MutT (NUDIX family)